MKLFYFFFILWEIPLSSKIVQRATDHEGFYLRAEFEPQAAVWVPWSSEAAKEGCSFADPLTKIIKELAHTVPVKVFVCQNEEVEKAKKVIEDGSIPAANISYYAMNSDNIWLRDIGSVLMVNNEGKKKIPDFQFNSYGAFPFLTNLNQNESEFDSSFRRIIANLFDIPVVSTDVISEGGNRETNGLGTLLLVEAVDKERNPDLTMEQLESEYGKVLGIKKTIWLKKGLVQDDHLFRGSVTNEYGQYIAYTTCGNGGHVDAFCRFVGPRTILLAEIDPEEALFDPIAYENQSRLEENYAILKSATDQYGMPFSIIRMPATHTFYIKMCKKDPLYRYICSLDFSSTNLPSIQAFADQEESLFVIATSYMNFLISNHVVLVPKYWREGYPEAIKQKDELAANILAGIYPEKKIIQIDIFNINLCGGGIHCCTLHEPCVMH